MHPRRIPSHQSVVSSNFVLSKIFILDLARKKIGATWSDTRLNIPRTNHFRTAQTSTCSKMVVHSHINSIAKKGRVRLGHTQPTHAHLLTNVPCPFCTQCSIQYTYSIHFARLSYISPLFRIRASSLSSCTWHVKLEE